MNLEKKEKNVVNIFIMIYYYNFSFLFIIEDFQFYILIITNIKYSHTLNIKRIPNIQ